MIYLFGDRLRELRKEKKLTQEDVAKMFNVSNNAVYSWEVGKTQPSIEIITELAQYFGVTTDYLLNFNQEDLDNIERLKLALKEAGIDDIKQALEIIDVLKNKKDTNK